MALLAYRQLRWKSLAVFAGRQLLRPQLRRPRRDINTNGYAYSYVNINAYTDSNTFGHADCDAYWHAECDTDVHARQPIHDSSDRRQHRARHHGHR